MISPPPPQPFFLYFLSQLYHWVIILFINCRHQGTATNIQGTETAFECALSFYFHFFFWDSRSHELYTTEQQYHTFYKIRCWMFVNGAQYLKIIRHCPISHLSLLSVCGKWTFMYCNRLLLYTLRTSLVNLWMNVPKWSKRLRIAPAQGVGSNGHCVGTM